ncbi:hypothetical protein DL98DRAFT_600761 [Cadophora sp. DSE1049]|nr:hypothetical protein DL98DRAFT_600761 [Cadophora sp. DSE1049]
MLSPAPSQQLLLSKSASNEIPVHAHCPPYDLTQQDLEQSKLKLAIVVKKCGSVKRMEGRIMRTKTGNTSYPMTSGDQY